MTIPLARGGFVLEIVGGYPSDQVHRSGEP